MTDIDILDYEASVPKYTETDENGFSARLETFQREHPDYPIVPVTKHPDIPDPTPNGRRSSLKGTTDARQSAKSAAYALQANIVEALFAHIASRDTPAIDHLVSSQGLISPDCPRTNGETPLLAAIRSHSAPTARTLLTLGADPNLLGKVATDEPPYDSDDEDDDVLTGDRTITPLMLAAATGQLAIVRLLVGDFGADDSIVAPRGETALWLAARAGHRDVVAYLPARRGGAWRRLRHSREAGALRRAVGLAGQVVRFLGWDVPRVLVYYIPRGAGLFVWKRRRDIWDFVVRVFRGLPRALRFVPEVVWAGIKGVPHFVRRVSAWISRVVPRAWEIVRKGLVDGVRKVGSAVAFAAQRMVSVLHSFFAAVISRLREVKLKDVGHDLVVALQALLVNLPGAVRAFGAQSVVVLRRAARAVFSNYWVRALIKVVTYFVLIVPRTLWFLLESLWACLGRGVEELISLINPKMVASERSRSWII